MNFRQIGLRSFLILGLFLGLKTSVKADQNSDFIAQANADFQTVANFVNGPFSNSLGFFTGLGWNTNPTVYDLGLGLGPHFSVGFAAGADFIGLPNMNSLNLPVVSASANFSLPSGVPLPYPVITARIGLFNGFDAGFRYTYLPPINGGNFGGNFSGWGIDLRYKIFDGLTAPTVTLSTSFDSMSGTFNVSTANINQSGTYTDNGTQYNSTLSGNSNYALNWNTRSMGAKISIGKSLGVFYPYASIGFQRNSGAITSTITGNFTETLSNGGTTSSSTFNTTDVAAGAPVVLEPKYVLGLDLGGGPGLQIAVVGESNGTDLAGALTLSAGF